MSPVAYNFKKGIDTPPWQWLAFCPVASNPGSSNVYDGKRYMYWAIQYGVVTATASTTALWRYDTWSNSWQYMAVVTSSNAGVDIEYDSVRNVLYIIHGTLTSWQVFNLNTTAVTVANVSCPAWVLTTMTTVLPAVAGPGASISMPSDDSVPAAIDNGTAAATGQTTTSIVSTPETATFGPGMVGLQVRILTGAQAGQIRTVTAVTAPSTMTVAPALPAALVGGSTYQVEQVADAATATTTTTVTKSTAAWPVNQYANMDVILTTGALAGQRRRIASNTATVLTLAAAVTGNTGTGPFSAAPGATDSFKIVPSKDFLYYQPGTTNTNLYKIDVAQTTGIAWATLAVVPAAFGAGGNTFYPAAYAPYNLVGLRGAASSNCYLYNIGLNTWTTITVFAGAETFSTGAASAMVTGKRKLMIQKEGTTRLYALDLLTGILEPAGTAPYTVPVGYEGKRARVVTTADGAQFLYLLRAGGQEFFRMPITWMD